MHTRRRQKGQGMIASKTVLQKDRVHFSNNSKAPNNSLASFYSTNNPNYLNDLYKQLHTVIPPHSNINSNNAEIIGTLIQTYNDPANMQKMVNLIYDPQSLTEENITFLQNYKKGTIGHQILQLAAANLSAPLKKKYLNFYRHQRATKKLKKMYNNSYTSKLGTIHSEWIPAQMTD